MGCRANKGKQEEDPLPIINLLMVGLASSGKTTLLNKIKGETGSFEQELGIDTLIINNKVKLIAFEMAGRAHATWQYFYSTAQIVVFVMDVTEVDQMEKINKILKEMDKQLPQRSKIIIAFNKIDLLMPVNKQKKNFAQEDSNITEFLNKNRNQLKIISKLKFDFLKHEVLVCKCSGVIEMGIQNILKIIYDVSLKEIYRLQDSPQKDANQHHLKSQNQVQRRD